MTEAERVGLVAKVSNGDADALQRLIVEYHDAFYRSTDQGLPIQLRARVSPEDVLQEAYVAAFRALASREVEAAPQDKHSSCRRGGGTEAAPRWLTFESPAQFFGWLEAIVRNKLQDVIHAAGRAKRAALREVVTTQSASGSYPDLLARLSGTGTTPSRAMSRGESVARLMAGMARLTDLQREVIRLRILEGVSAAETARRLGRTEEAVHALCYRALASLRTLLFDVA